MHTILSKHFSKRPERCVSFTSNGMPYLPSSSSFLLFLNAKLFPSFVHGFACRFCLSRSVDYLNANTVNASAVLPLQFSPVLEHPAGGQYDSTSEKSVSSSFCNSAFPMYVIRLLVFLFPALQCFRSFGMLQCLLLLKVVRSDPSAVIGQTI